MFDSIVHDLHFLKRKYAAKLDLARLPLISKYRKKIIFSLRKKVVDNVNGYIMHVDDMDTLALSWHHVFEPMTTEFFKQNIKKGQTVADLGANIGYFTLLFSGLVGSEGHVYAFEPEPDCANLLKKNLEVNSVKNVTVVEKAVTSEIAIKNLYINKINRGNHQIFDDGSKRQFIQVQSTTLDDFFIDKELKIDWIKMDIEGAEMQALNGMKKFLSINSDVVLVTEINVPGLIAAGTSVEEYIGELKSMKFEFEVIDEQVKKIYSVSSEKLYRNYASVTKVHPNIICRKK